MISKLTVPPAQIDHLREIRRVRIEQLKERAKGITLSRIPRGQSYKAIAVSVDASNVPIETDVVDAVAIRCADSNGEVYFQNIVPTDGPTAAIRDFLDEMFTQVPVLDHLLKRMQAPTWEVLADFNLVQGRTDLDRFVMELLEWGSLVALAESSSQTILLKDGLLRGKAIRPQGGFLRNLRGFFEQNCKTRGNYLVGIAKQSAVLEKNMLLLQYVSGFTDNQGFYLEIPQDLLEESYGWRYLASDVIWGQLYFVRVQPHASARVMTIEVPAFLTQRLTDVLKILADFKVRSLPDRFRGLPDPVARAHENTNLLVNFGKSIEKEIMK